MSIILMCLVVGVSSVACAQQFEVSSFTGQGADEGARFGSSVAIDGELCVVGAPFDGFDGAAYVFDLSDPAKPVQLSRLTVDEPFTGFFREAVDIENGIVLVGSFGQYVYLFDAFTGERLGELTSSDWEQIDGFGESVALAEGRAVVSAALDINENGEFAGAAYVFEEGPFESHKLLAGGGKTEDRFGWPVDAQGNLSLIGAIENGPSGNAFLFRTDTGQQRGRLKPSESESKFGYTLAFDQDLAVVGTTSDSAYVFDIADPLHPIELARVHILSVQLSSGGVGVDGTTAIISAPVDDTLGPFVGAVYVYDLTDPTNPVQVVKLLASDMDEPSGFAQAVAIDDGLAVVGSPGQGDRGTVYVYRVSTCLADVDGDDDLDVLDFVAFQLLWQDQDPRADCDGNAEFDVLDFVCFQQRFAKGCP